MPRSEALLILGALGALLLGSAGCRQKAPAVFVDLGAIETKSTPGPSSSIPRFQPKSGGLPAQATRLPDLGSAQVALSDTRARIRAARELIRQNRQEALRSLTAAIYRALADRAEADRIAAFGRLDNQMEELRNETDRRISDRLHESARTRWPLANRLALLVGFPPTDPAGMPSPETPLDRRRRAEAVAAWTALLAEDAAYEAAVRALLKELETDLSTRRAEIVGDFGRWLNEASDRAGREAQAALANSLPDSMGRFAEETDVQVPASPGRTLSYGSVERLRGGPSTAPQTSNEPQHKNLEHDLAIWLAQNGYRRAARAAGVPNRTREFKAWLEARNAGL